MLYAHNATVYIAGRSASKAHRAIAAIKQDIRASTGRLEFLSLDLADLRTVRGSAVEFLRREDRLDVLVNNAGYVLCQRGWWDAGEGKADGMAWHGMAWMLSRE